MGRGVVSHVTFAKPERGSFRRERLGKAESERRVRETNKRRSKTRDGHKCRWPHTCEKGDPLESAHLVNLSQGGSDDTSNLFTACQRVHQGAFSLHTKDRRIEPLTDRGCDGPCAFYERNKETGIMAHIASERAVGISEARS